MPLYTRTGDKGETQLGSGDRVFKDTPRVAAYGAVDELNAGLGLARSFIGAQRIDQILHEVQNDLFNLGAEAANPDRRQDPVAGVCIGEDHVRWLEQCIDQIQEELPPLREFILPGGTQGAAALHLVRTICRRAERQFVTLAREGPVAPVLIAYLNRLSDLLFVLARLVNHQTGQGDVSWQKGYDR